MNSKEPKFCSNCGAGLEPGSRYCAECGQLVEVFAVRTGKNVTSDASEAFICPKCKKSDAVVKVKTFHEEEEMAQRDRYGSDEDFVDSDEPQEEPKTLAEKLAPPPELDMPGVHVLWFVIPFIPPLNALLIWFAPMASKFRIALISLGVMATAAWVVKYRIEDNYQGSMTMLERELPDLFGFTVLDLPFIVVFLLLIVYYTGLIMMNKKMSGIYRTETLEKWKKAVSRWNKLFYCARCKGVFISEPSSGEKSFSKLEDMNSLLYEEPATTQ